MELLKAELGIHGGVRCLKALVQDDDGTLGVEVFPIGHGAAARIEPADNWEQKAAQLAGDLVALVEAPAQAEPPASPGAEPAPATGGGEP